MSRIRGTNTGPEVKFRKALWALGFRYRLNANNLPGKPDIVLVKYKLAIFIDGEFWHGFNWETKKHRIKNNTDYWIKKIEGNIARDELNKRKLQEEGYKVLRFWEHEIRRDLDRCISTTLQAISISLN